jgi:UrcA family protein
MTHLATSRTLTPKCKLALLLLIGGLSVAGATGASTTDSDTPTVVIHYTTASLATDSGLHALYRRIEMAAERVCPHDSAASLPDEALIKCRHAAIAEAVSKTHNQRLVALYAKSGPKAGRHY